MTQRISDVFPTTNPKLLKDHKVFNGFIDKDSKLYVDPRLLSKTSVYELQSADNKVMNYFENRIKEIQNLIVMEEKLNAEKRNNLYSLQPSSLRYKIEYEKYEQKRIEARDNLIFSEIPLVGLGYSTKGNDGKGIGWETAWNLLDNIKSFIEVGIVDPILFQLAAIFEKNIGADKTSDMIVSIILPELALFSSRIAKELNMPKIASTTINSQEYFDLPCYLNKGIILVPEDILTFLPITYLWTAKDSTKHHNLELRNYMNDKLRTLFSDLTWKELLKNKIELKKVLVKNPDMMTKLIDTYKSIDTDDIAYDFSKDSKNLFNWHDVARYYGQNYPLSIENISDEYFINNEELLETIRVYFSQIVSFGLSKEFYKETRVSKQETIAVSILSELLDYHLKINNSCLSVECLLKESVITFSNQIKIILKFSSNSQIIEYCHKLIRENNHANSTNTTTVLFLMIVNKGKSESEINSSFYVNGNNIYIESEFFKIFYIDARL